MVSGDACATRTLKFKETEVHAATLPALQGNYARVISTDELLAELKSTAVKDSQSGKVSAQTRANALRAPLSLNCRHRAHDQRLDASEIRDIFRP